MYQAVSELPQANRDTLAFLMIHLQRVSQSPDTKMDIANLAKVFGPTIVAHTVPNPDPVTMFQDIKRQLKVGFMVCTHRCRRSDLCNALTWHNDRNKPCVVGEHMQWPAVLGGSPQPGLQVLGKPGLQRD